MPVKEKGKGTEQARTAKKSDTVIDGFDGDESNGYVPFACAMNYSDEDDVDDRSDVSAVSTKAWTRVYYEELICRVR